MSTNDMSISQTSSKSISNSTNPPTNVVPHSDSDYSEKSNADDQSPILCACQCDLPKARNFTRSPNEITSFRSARGPCKFSARNFTSMVHF